MAVAFFSTWTTYGTWLPGDARGWFQRDRGLQTPDLMRSLEAAFRLADDGVTLDATQRRLVEETIAAHCALRGWVLHAVNCRTNHVHVVVTAPDRLLAVPREQFKSWCSRRLNERKPRPDWWTARGWDEYIDDEDGLAVVVDYVRDRQ